MTTNNMTLSALTPEELSKDSTCNFKWDYTRCTFQLPSGKEVPYSHYVEWCNEVDPTLPESAIYTFAKYQVENYHHMITLNEDLMEVIDMLEFAWDWEDALNIDEVQNGYILTDEERQDKDEVMKRFVLSDWIPARSIGVESDVLIRTWV